MREAVRPDALVRRHEFIAPATSLGCAKVGNRLIDSRTQFAAIDPHLAFVPIRRLGGQTGWYYGNWLWRLRGRLDRLVGGVGLRRGRREIPNSSTPAKPSTSRA